jgi:hypothetical protein
MNRNIIVAAMLPLAAITGCAEPFEYDKATPEQQTQFLEDSSRGIYDGLDKTLPRGAGNVYAAMGERKIYPDRKRIEITVDVRSGGENINPSVSDKEKMNTAICAEFMGSPMERAGVTVSVRYEVPAGGSVLSFLLNSERCGRYVKDVA